MISGKPALVDAAGGDGEAQWLAANDRAEVTARAENPAATMEVPAESTKAHRHFFERCCVDVSFSAKPKIMLLVNNRPVLWSRNRLALRTRGFNPGILGNLHFFERFFR